MFLQRRVGDQCQDFARSFACSIARSGSFARTGLVEEDLEPLHLSKEQRSALLIMLRQSKRMRVVMRDSKHTYVIPQ